MNDDNVKLEENKKVDKEIAQIFDDADFVYETVLNKLNLPANEH